MRYEFFINNTDQQARQIVASWCSKDFFKNSFYSPTNNDTQYDFHWKYYSLQICILFDQFQERNGVH